MNDNMKYSNSIENFVNSSQISFTDLEIDIKCERIGLNGAIILGIALSNCKNIQNLTLNIQKNQNFTTQGLSYLFQDIHSLIHLQSLKLNLSLNSIQDEDCENLSHVLVNCFNLQLLDLDFYCNEITDVGISSLASVLMNFPQLKILKLMFELNCIGMKGAFNLCSALQISQNITNLSLNIYENFLNLENEMRLMKKIHKIKRLVKKSIYF
ncbi:hypothetical protein ABPG74_002788 [Tetrahymena malaccensis]